jgi:hypothetical protein
MVLPALPDLVLVESVPSIYGRILYTFTECMYDVTRHPGTGEFLSRGRDRSSALGGDWKLHARCDRNNPAFGLDH